LRKYIPSLVVFVACCFFAAAVAVVVVALSNRSDDKAAQVERVANERAADAVAAAIWDRYDSDIAGCHRGDVVRTMLHEFLATAEAARRMSPEPGDLVIANKYAEYNSRIWPLKECTDIIPPPSVPRP
jgi:hypothetical protein